MTKDFSQVKKRRIISPFNLYWALKWELGIHTDSEYLPTYFKPRHELSVDMLSVNFSYKDTLVFKNILDFITAEFKLIRKEPPSEHERIT